MHWLIVLMMVNPNVDGNQVEHPGRLYNFEIQLPGYWSEQECKVIKDRMNQTLALDVTAKGGPELEYHYDYKLPSQARPSEFRGAKCVPGEF